MGSRSGRGRPRNQFHASMNHPAELRYSKSHEWVRVEGDRAVIGITDFAQHELGDVVYLELPDPGRSFRVDAVFGAVESVKAVSDLICPVSGEVVETNTTLMDETGLVNSSPYGDAWMIVIRMSDPTEVDALLDATAYEAFLAEG